MCARAGMLDVQQIFGRAGRPQFEQEGLGIIITQHAQLAHYLGMLTHQAPIESQFVRNLEDNLNAEIVLGAGCPRALPQKALSVCSREWPSRDPHAMRCWVRLAARAA